MRKQVSSQKAIATGLVLGIGIIAAAYPAKVPEAWSLEHPQTVQQEYMGMQECSAEARSHQNQTEKKTMAMGCLTS
jgi:hypothetical protein